jgi:hypothetical protein
MSAPAAPAAETEAARVAAAVAAQTTLDAALYRAVRGGAVLDTPGFFQRGANPYAAIGVRGQTAWAACTVSAANRMIAAGFVPRNWAHGLTQAMGKTKHVVPYLQHNIAAGCPDAFPVLWALCGFTSIDRSVNYLKLYTRRAALDLGDCPVPLLDLCLRRGLYHAAKSLLELGFPVDKFPLERKVTVRQLFTTHSSITTTHDVALLALRVHGHDEITLSSQVTMDAAVYTKDIELCMRCLDAGSRPRRHGPSGGVGTATFVPMFIQQHARQPAPVDFDDKFAYALRLRGERPRPYGTDRWGAPRHTLMGRYAEQAVVERQTTERHVLESGTVRLWIEAVHHMHPEKARLAIRATFLLSAWEPVPDEEAAAPGEFRPRHSGCGFARLPPELLCMLGEKIAAASVEQCDAGFAVRHQAVLESTRQAAADEEIRAARLAALREAEYQTRVCEAMAVQRENRAAMEAHRAARLRAVRLTGDSTANLAALMDVHAALCCAGCYRVLETVKRCGRCHDAYYCSKACQISAWPTHREVCVPYTA